MPEGFTVTGSRPLGGVWLLDGLWKTLGVAGALGKIVGARQFTTDIERVLFALVANRCLDPASKLAAAEWVREDVHVPGLAGMDEDQAYRAMDLLVEADTQGKVQEAVFFATADLLNLEVDPLFFDTTSTYFERDTPDPAGEDETPAFRAYGHSKDSRPDLPQVVIGLAVTREGIPVRVWVWPGNTNDMSVLKEVKDDLRDWRLGRVVTVVDRGFSSEENLTYLTRSGGHWIAGERMRNGSARAQEALSRQGRYRDVRENLRVKEVRVGERDAARRYIVCHNPAEAERDKQTRDATLERLTAELERITAAPARSKSVKDAEAHHRAECALRDHKSLGRYLRQTPTGRLLLDRKKIAAEERLDGKYLLSTSDPDLSAEDVALGYKNLLEAERGFRDMKSTLELRPVFHRLEHRIRAHVLICWLGLLMIRIAERQTGHTWRRIALEHQRLHLVSSPAPTDRSSRPPHRAPRPPSSSPPPRSRRRRRSRRSPPPDRPDTPPKRPASVARAWAHGHTPRNTPKSQAPPGIFAFSLTYSLRNPGKRLSDNRDRPHGLAQRRRTQEAPPGLNAFFLRLRNVNLNLITLVIAAATVLPDRALLTAAVGCGAVTALWAATAVMTARGHWERFGELATGLSILWATVAAAVAVAEGSPEHREGILLAYAGALVASPLFAYWIDGRIALARNAPGIGPDGESFGASSDPG